MTITILAVRRSAMTISTQADGWNEAYAKAKGIVTGWQGNLPHDPIVHFFLSDEEDLMQYTPEEIRGM